jgi:hypothetical protein
MTMSYAANGRSVRRSNFLVFNQIVVIACILRRPRYHREPLCLPGEGDTTESRWPWVNGLERESNPRPQSAKLLPPVRPSQGPNLDRLTNTQARSPLFDVTR